MSKTKTTVTRTTALDLTAAAKMAANADAMYRTALAVFRAGHLPVTGEAVR